MAAAGDGAAVRAWGAYCDGIKGARMLTWSRGLRERFGLREQDDAGDVDDQPPGEHVARIPGAVWDVVRNVPGMKVALLAAAEAGKHAVSASTEIVRENDVSAAGQVLEFVGPEPRSPCPRQMNL